MRCERIDHLIYKFLDQQHVALLLAGKMKFGRLMRYRLLEIASGDRWIGDVREGVAITHVAEANLADLAQAPLKVALEEAGFIRAVPGAPVVVNGVRIVQEVDAFICSFSSGEFAPLHEVMCRSPDRPNYTAAVEVLDQDALVSRVEAGVLPCGRPVKDVFHVECGRVVYDGHEADWNGALMGAHPYRKEGAFEGQHEWRVVLYPREPVGGDYVDLQIDAAELFVQIQVEAIFVDDRDWRPTPAVAAALIRQEQEVERNGPRPADWYQRQDNRDLVASYFVLRHDGGCQAADSACVQRMPRPMLVRRLAAYLNRHGIH